MWGKARLAFSQSQHNKDDQEGMDWYKGHPHTKSINGSWMNGNPQPMQENGVPVVNNVQISGSSQTIAPFLRE